MIDRTKWFFHPVLIFVFSVTALAASLFLYIYWYVEASAGIADIVRRFNLDRSQIITAQTWLVILTLSLLVGVILAGIFIIFVYNRKLIQLYRMQYNFINNFTHELKTPLTSMNLYIETFLRHDLSREDQVRYLHFMLRDVKRLEDDVSRILNLARIESGSYEDTLVTADLVETVRHFYEQNGHLFRNGEIRISNPAGKSFPFPIRPSLFDMLLMNVTTNALKYNDGDVPKLDITFVPEKKRLRIRFEDNGIGLERKQLKKIFRKFYQAGSPDNMTARGSGIGLYLVRHIARMHRGRIVAESAGPGKGSVFTLTLPLKSIE